MLYIFILLCLVEYTHAGSINSSMVYTITPRSHHNKNFTGSTIGVAHKGIARERKIPDTEIGHSTIAKLIKMKKYAFIANGNEYELYPMDRIMQGSRCIGHFERIITKKDRIVLVYGSGDICSGIRNYSTIVEIKPSMETYASKSLITESGNFKFQLGIPKLFDVVHIQYVDLLLPTIEEESTEEGDSTIAILRLNESGKPILVRTTKRSRSIEKADNLYKQIALNKNDKITQEKTGEDSKEEKEEPKVKRKNKSSSSRTRSEL